MLARTIKALTVRRKGVALAFAVVSISIATIHYVQVWSIASGAAQIRVGDPRSEVTARLGQPHYHYAQLVSFSPRINQYECYGSFIDTTRTMIDSRVARIFGGRYPHWYQQYCLQRSWPVRVEYSKDDLVSVVYQ